MTEQEKEFIGKQIELFQPLVKTTSSGKATYEAVLSDDSTDRDDEIVGKKALQKVMDDESYIVGLIDHENKVFNQVCEWTNKRIENRKGHNAFIAEPNFYLSNPKAQQLKGMLDEGAIIGISIGAIIKDYEMKEIDGSEKRVFTELEILEASFVAIPANKHARIMAVAKMFKKQEGKPKMTDKTYSEKEYKEKSELVDNLTKEKEDSTKEMAKIVTEKEAAEKLLTEQKTESDKILSETTEKLEATEKELKEIQDMPFYKATHTEETEEEKKETKELSEAMEKGFLPIVPIGGN